MDLKGEIINPNTLCDDVVGSVDNSRCYLDVSKAFDTVSQWQTAEVQTGGVNSEALGSVAIRGTSAARLRGVCFVVRQVYFSSAGLSEGKHAELHGAVSTVLTRLCLTPDTALLTSNFKAHWRNLGRDGQADHAAQLGWIVTIKTRTAWQYTGKWVFM